MNHTIMPVLLCVVSYNAWNDHVLGWWKHKDDPNVLFLKYEDLQKVMFSSVSTIALELLARWLV